MMFDNIKDYVSPKRFSVVAYLCVTFHFSCGIVFSTISKSVRDSEMDKFICAVDTNFPALKVHIEKDCLAIYDDVYNSPLRFSSFVPFSFGLLFAVSIVYWFIVTSRFVEIEKLSNKSKQYKTGANGKSKQQDRKPFYVFSFYLGHLVARFVFSTLLIILQQTLLYSSGFETEFNCVYQDLAKGSQNVTTAKNASIDLSSVTCKNFTALDKELYGRMVCVCNAIFAIFALGEVIYLIFCQRCHTWSCDAEFVVVYFLQQQYDREYSRLTGVTVDNSTLTITEIYKKKVLEASLTPDINYGPNTSLDEMFIDVLIQSGQAPHQFCKNMDRHEIYDVYMKVPKDSIRLEKIKDLFYPNRDTEDKLPRTILALGRPGIGKTVLTRKLMHDWAKEVDGFYCDKIAFFFKFRWFNFEELKNLTLRELLRYGCELEENEFESLLDEISNETKNVILIFDGFDEGVSNLQEFQNCLDRSRKYSNEPDVSMSAMLLFMKLMFGHMLKDATILVTSRPTASEFYSKFAFQRNVEILGFTSEKIEKYVETFCVNYNRTNLKPEIWTYITSSSERMNLCYVPVTCFIVCVTLFNRLIDVNNDNPLPTTLTELYEEALVYFNKYHDRNENENDLKKLQDLAFFGIENDILVFRGELANEKMKECGLIHCLPKPIFQIQVQFCFIHLTMQEFLAAKHIVVTKKPEEINQFISSQFKEGKWHLVLQFLAGLLGKKIKISSQFRCCVSSFAQHFEVDIDGDDVVCPLTPDTVLGMKCVIEMESDEILVETATTSLLEYVTKLDMKATPTLSPSDCAAVVLVCKHLKMLTTFYAYGISFGCLVEATKLLQGRCIEELVLDWNDVEDFRLQNVLDELKSECHLDHEHSELTILSLFKNNITDAGFLKLLQHLKVHGSGLQELHIGENQITSSGMSAFSDVLGDEACNRLKVLDISGNDIGNDGACYLFKALIESQSKLRSVNFNNCSLTSECVFFLTKALSGEHCEITEISIGDNEIGDTGVRVLCEAFQTKNCKLADLNLHYCELTDECMPFLREALKHGLCNLKKLNIGANDIGDCGVRMLCEALTTEECKLANLSLSSCWLTDECMPFICQALGDKYCYLTDLSLNNNKFAGSHLSLLVDALKLEHCRLQCLDISFNLLTEEGKQLLVDTMEFEHCNARGLNIRW